MSEVLRDEQARFRGDRSFVDQNATLRIVMEQGMEWSLSLYVNFVDFEGAFDGVDRNTLLKIMRHYGIPEKYVNIIRNSYEHMSFRVIHGSELTEAFKIETDGRQGCLLSPFLFLLAIGWIMKTLVDNNKQGIQWNMGKHLKDLDFADNLALLSHTKEQMQQKTDKFVDTAACLGIKIHPGKTKNFKINSKHNS